VSIPISNVNYNFISLKRKKQKKRKARKWERYDAASNDRREES